LKRGSVFRESDEVGMGFTMHAHEHEMNKTDSAAEVDLRALAFMVWHRKKLVLLILGVFAIGGVGLAYLWPRTYEATATVFPMSSSSGSALSDYAGLASLAGINLPLSGATSSPGKTVNALLSSRLLIEKLVQDLSLLSAVPTEGKTEEERTNNLVRALRRNLRSKEDPKTGVISVSVELENPQLAQRVTNQVLTILDTLLVEKSLTTNQKKRVQLDRQILEQGKKLTEYQLQMAQFQKETTLLNPTAQAGKAVDAYTTMIQQKMELELQLATAQASYSSDNPRITLLMTQLKSLESQIEMVKNQVNGDLPSIKMAPENMIRYQNLARDLEIATKIYAGLLASLEQSKLESDKEQVYIEVLDRALVPTEGKPSRTMIVVVSLAMGVVVSILVIFILALIRRTKEDPFVKSQSSFMEDRTHS